MPFEMKITDVTYKGREITVSGRLVLGAYFGPEAVEFTTIDAKSFRSMVVQHSMSGNLSWPVVPDKEIVLSLTISNPLPGIKLDATKPLVGVGNIFTNKNRVDITNLLSPRLFLALELSHRLETELSCEFFKINMNEFESLYQTTYSDQQEQGIWPYVRLDIDNERFIELEYAASIEHQSRFWIGNQTTKILMGYHSGHFSLPAFSKEDINWCFNKLENHPLRHLVLLLLTGCYTDTIPDEWPEKIKAILQDIPGVDPLLIDRVSEELIFGSQIDKILWINDPDLGWINTWPYSQRNPKSEMSILRKEGFQFIRQFFG